MAYPSNSLDSTMSAISSITKKFYIPNLADEVNTSNVALMKMPKKTADGGTDIRQPVRFKRGTVTNYSGSEVLDVSQIDKKAMLIFDWKQKDAPITITGLDQIKNNGAEKVIDHVQSEIKLAKEDIIDNFATGIYSAGTDSKDIDGALVWLSTSNTYGGISQSSESWLQAQVDSTTTALSLAAMQSTYEACKEGPDAPGLITTDETEFNAFWSLLQPQQRFSDVDTAKAGFRNLMFNGATVSEDSYCPSGYMVFWNMKHVALYSSSKRKFPGEFRDFERPVNQDVMVAHILWAGNAVCSEPRKQGVMSALTS